MYEQPRSVDPDAHAAIASELRRQREHLELVPSEIRVSLAVLEALANPMQNIYAEGYPRRPSHARDCGQGGLLPGSPH